MTGIRDSEEKKKREESVQQGTDTHEVSFVDTISEKATEEENESRIESALTSTLGNDYQHSFSIKTQPNQPRNITLPQRSFGNTYILKRSFQSTWLDKIKWLDYDENIDLVFCFTCNKALENNLLSSLNADPAFTWNGFCNWKHAMDTKKGFRKHKTSDSHLKAVARYVSTPATTLGDVRDLVSD